MRRELYKAIENALTHAWITPDGELMRHAEECPAAGAVRAVEHVDLWNHNVEFLTQEAPWPRPAVFVEFGDINWDVTMPGMHYRAQPEVLMHIVFDWDPENRGRMFALPEIVHELLCGLKGKTFTDFDLARSMTNHDHEDIVEAIEVYTCMAVIDLSHR